MHCNHFSFVIPSSFCLQSFPASGSFPKSQLFTSGGQSTGVSASILPMNIQDWFSLRLTGLISLLSKGLLGVFSNTTAWQFESISSSALGIHCIHVYTGDMQISEMAFYFLLSFGTHDSHFSISFSIRFLIYEKSIMVARRSPRSDVKKKKKKEYNGKISSSKGWNYLLYINILAHAMCPVYIKCLHLNL